MAEALCEIAGAPASYAVRAFPEARKKIDIGDFYSDGSLIERTLEWKPRVNARIALRRTLAFFRRELRHYA